MKIIISIVFLFLGTQNIYSQIYFPKNNIEKAILEQSEETYRRYGKGGIHVLLKRNYSLDEFRIKLKKEIKFLKKKSRKKFKLKSLKRIGNGDEFEKLETNLIAYYSNHLDSEREKKIRKKEELRKKNEIAKAEEDRRRQQKNEEEKRMEQEKLINDAIKKELEKVAEENKLKEEKWKLKVSEEALKVINEKKGIHKNYITVIFALVVTFISLFIFITHTIEINNGKISLTKKNISTINQINKTLKDSLARHEIEIEKLTKNIIESRESIANKDKKITFLTHEKKEYEDLISKLLTTLEINDSSNTITEVNQLILQKLDQLESINNYLNQRKNFTDSMISKISKGKTKEVIEKLILYSRENEDKKLLSECIQISSRFQVLNNKLSSGIIDHDKSSLELSRINKSIIDLLIEYEKE